jgi:inner membrane protein YidH
MSKDEKPKSDNSQQYLANERTFLAWIRTCIALIGLGFIVAKFSFFIEEFNIIIQRYLTKSASLSNINSQPLMDHGSSLIGTGIIILSLFLVLFALKNYCDTDREIRFGMYVPKHMIMYITAAIFVTLSSTMILYLLYLSNS